MRIVIDASVVMSWHFPDELNSFSDDVLRQIGRVPAIAPEIWWYEVRNVLLQGERRGRTQPERVTQFLKFLTTLPIEIVKRAEGDSVVTLARRHRLTFYDAAYLELARRERLPLATLDQALVKAAVDEGIALVTA